MPTNSVFFARDMLGAGGGASPMHVSCHQEILYYINMVGGKIMCNHV